MKKRTKKILGVFLCIIFVFNSIVTAFARPLPLQSELLSPISLPDLSPEPYTGFSIPKPQQGSLPKIPQIPRSEDILSAMQPFYTESKPPVFENQQSLPVNIKNGNLQFGEIDINLSGVGFNVIIERSYNSENKDDGPFGKGWQYNLDSIIRMYADFHIGEFRQDGTTRRYEFVKDDPNAFVTSYDGDSMTNYELHKGHYEEANGDTLVRISQYEYLVTTSNGTKYTYYGYDAPWREYQSEKAGKLIRKEDIHGNAVSYTYDSNGRIIGIQDTGKQKHKYYLAKQPYNIYNGSDESYHILQL